MIPDPVDLAEQVSQTNGFQDLAPPLQVALFLGGMVLISTALVMLTSFTRIVIVLSFVRRALTTQEIPPTPVLIGLSLFLTVFVMGPTFHNINQNAIEPFLKEEGGISAKVAWQLGANEFHHFMRKQTRKNDLALFIHMSGIRTPETPEDTPLRVLIPAFVISELKTAFIMGFCIYIPFLLIDLVVSTILMAMGMMMMPPVVISTPLKILLFVLVDGWHLISRALTASFA